MMITRFPVLFLAFIASLEIFAQPYYGVQTHCGQIYRPDYDSATVVAMLDSIKKAGFSCIRDEMYWSLVETQPGVFSFPPQFDFYAEQARLRGISILLILNYNNPLYAAHAGAGITTDTNRALFLRYCKAVVQRYSPKGIKLYEIWNEPNLQMFWDPSPSAADYVKLLQKIYLPLKQTDGTITIIAGATSPAEGAAAPNIPWTQFLSSVFAAGGGNSMDAVSFHLYRVDKSPEQFLDADMLALQAMAGTGKNIFLSECGYPTNTGWPNVTLQKQAEYVPRLYLYGKKFPALKQVSYYDFRNDGTDPASTEANFGLVYQNLAPKPAYTSMSSLMRAISGKPLSRALTQGAFYFFTFADSTGKTHAFWTTGSTAVKEELFGSSWLRVINSYGHEYFIYDSNKRLEINYTGLPLYLTEMNQPPALLNIAIRRVTDSLIAGASLQLSLRAVTANGLTAFIDSSAVSWQSLDSNAAVSSTGMITALRAGIARIRAEFAGKTDTLTLTILPPYTYLEIEPYNSFDTSAVTYVSMLPETSCSLTDTNFTTPPHALRVNYALKYASISAHRVVFNKIYSLPGEPDSLLLDVYNDGFGHILNFTFTDADGQDFSINSAPNLLTNIRGWKTVKVPMTNFGSTFTYPVKLKRVLLYLVRPGAVVDSVYRGALLLDNLRVHNGLLSSYDDFGSGQPADFELYQNFPNPFNPATTIRYVIGGAPAPAGTDNAVWYNVRLTVYDVLGREVTKLVNEIQRAGEYAVPFDAALLPSGIYIYELRVNGLRDVRKMVLLR